MNIIIGKRIDIMFTFFTLITLLVEKVGSFLAEEGRHGHIHNSERTKTLLRIKQPSNFRFDIFNNLDIIIIIIIIIKWTPN
jgi:hypothetical protein